jgi:hypothetical protein
VQVEALWLDRRAAAYVRSSGSVGSAEAVLGEVVARAVAEQGRYLHHPTDSSALLLGSVLRLGSSAHSLAQVLLRRAVSGCTRKQRLTILIRGTQEGTRVVTCGSIRGVPLALSTCGEMLGEQLLPATGTAVVPPCVVLVPVPPLLSAELALLAVDISASLHQVERLLARGSSASGVDTCEGSVLVIGCGRVGLMTLAFVRRIAPKARVLAVDVSLERINLAHTLVAKPDTVKQMYVRTAPRRSASAHAHVLPLLQQGCPAMGRAGGVCAGAHGRTRRRCRPQLHRGAPHRSCRDVGGSQGASCLLRALLLGGAHCR